MSRRILVVPLVTALAAAGCIASGDSGGTSAFALGGAFTRDATQEDVSELESRMRSLGARDIAMMEPFPLQFSARGFTSDECRGARAVAASLDYVASVSACRTLEPSENPDEPVSDEPT